MSLICVFPGQGAQKKGMGEELFERFPEQLAIAGEVMERSLLDVCRDRPEGILSDTRYTQPALFAVCAMAWMAREEDGGKPPDFLAGHSLGEYSALHAAGCFGFRDGMELTRKRGEIMGQEQGGGMAAVLGIPPGKIRQCLDQEGFGQIDLANQNSPLQTVVSGDRRQLKECAPALKRAGARVIPLRVSGAFHSRRMSGARKRFSQWLSGFRFRPPRCPVIANATALPYPEEGIRDILARQIDSPVLWTGTIGLLLQERDPVFEEIGPGRTLTRLIDQIRQTGLSGTD